MSSGADDRKLQVLLKAEADVLRTFGLLGGPASAGAAASLYEFVIEPPARTEVFAQQLSDHSDPAWSSSIGETRAKDPEIDVVVLSLAGDLTRKLYRVRDTGQLVDPAPGEIASGDLEPAFDDFDGAAASVVESLGLSGNPMLVWFTASTVCGVDEPHRWASSEERPFSVRANRLNLSVARLSQRTGVCFVDADRILAEMGAGSHVEGPCMYSVEASAMLLDEFNRVMVETAKVEPLGSRQP